MIQVNELRIGNYINHNDGSQTDDIRRVSAIHKDGVESIVKGCRFATAIRHQSLVYAIPLSEEILLKCGFYRIKRSIGLYYKTKNCDIITIYSDGNFKWCDRYINTNIIHLHQLQNLYFALTGEELNIEL